MDDSKLDSVINFLASPTPLRIACSPLFIETNDLIDTEGEFVLQLSVYWKMHFVTYAHRDAMSKPSFTPLVKVPELQQQQYHNNPLSTFSLRSWCGKVIFDMVASFRTRSRRKLLNDALTMQAYHAFHDAGVRAQLVKVLYPYAYEYETALNARKAMVSDELRKRLIAHKRLPPLTPPNETQTETYIKVSEELAQSRLLYDAFRDTVTATWNKLIPVQDDREQEILKSLFNMYYPEAKNGHAATQFYRLLNFASWGPSHNNRLHMLVRLSTSYRSDCQYPTQPKFLFCTLSIPYLDQEIKLVAMKNTYPLIQA